MHLTEKKNKSNPPYLLPFEALIPLFWWFPFPCSYCPIFSFFHRFPCIHHVPNSDPFPRRDLVSSQPLFIFSCILSPTSTISEQSIVSHCGWAPAYWFRFTIVHSHSPQDRPALIISPCTCFPEDSSSSFFSPILSTEHFPNRMPAVLLNS